MCTLHKYLSHVHVTFINYYCQYDRFINYFVPAGSHTHRTGMCRNFKFCSFYVPLDCSVDVISILSERAIRDGCGIRQIKIIKNQ